MIPSPLAIIDVETTGMSAYRDRIIEIGALRIENGKIVKTINTLINPDCSIPPEITVLTGITGSQLENAPQFPSLREDLKDIFDGAVFVAHNARFDYSFIKHEYALLDESFTAKTLCTAKLSRALFPSARHHNLDSIIERFHIPCTTRHRAYDDAKVLWEFLQILEKTTEDKTLEQVLRLVMKRPSLPTTISSDTVDKLPEGAGVYIFYDENGSPLYVGKSIHVKDRVISHFMSATHRSQDAKIVQSIASIETRNTEGELGALLLESQLIKEYQPTLNRLLRKSNNLIGVTKTVTEDGYFSVATKTLSDISISEIETILAVFRTGRQMKEYFIELSREYSLCQKLLGIEKTKQSCFGYQLNTCNGACIKKEQPIRYNMRFTQAFTKTKIRQWPFPGPIVIHEGQSAHIVSHWCYLGELSNNEEYLTETTTQLSFDYDAYKILASYLLKKSTMQKIHVLRKQ